MKHITIIFILSILFFTSFSLLAEEGYIPFGTGIVQGKPTFYRGTTIAYYIWEHKGIVNVRWSSNGSAHIFKGKITADTAFSNVVRVGAEQGDFVIKPVRNEIVFSATTSTLLDGFSFQINKPSTVKVSLFVDGKLIDPSYIYIGKDNANPPGNPVIFYRP